MKRALSLILVLVMVLSLCACGSSNECTVTFSDGSTKSMTPSEIVKIKSSDAVTWKKYSGATVSGTGKITKIESGTGSFKDYTASVVRNGVEYKYSYYVVTIDKKVQFLTRAEVFSGMSVGDTVTYTGVIDSGTDGSILRLKYYGSVDNPVQLIFPA